MSEIIVPREDVADEIIEVMSDNLTTDILEMAKVIDGDADIMAVRAEFAKRARSYLISAYDQGYVNAERIIKERQRLVGKNWLDSLALDYQDE